MPKQHKSVRVYNLGNDIVSSGTIFEMITRELKKPLTQAES